MSTPPAITVDRQNGLTRIRLTRGRGNAINGDVVIEGGQSFSAQAGFADHDERFQLVAKPAQEFLLVFV